MFAKIRKEEREIKSAKKITLEFDINGETLDRTRLRELFLEEIEQFKSMKKLE
jgi:hypothetical protein